MLLNFCVNISDCLFRGQKEVAVLLLQNGIDTNIRNARGQTALEMSRDAQMKQLLEMQPIKQLQKSAQRFEGLILRVGNMEQFVPT